MTKSILKFEKNQDKILYNPTIPFYHNGKQYIGIRKESLNSELDTYTKFAYFQKDKNMWIIDSKIPKLYLQDPNYSLINGEIIISGIKVYEEENQIKYQQEFYKGNSIENLKYFASGPIGMKDICLVDLKDKIGVFTRPQGKIGGRGKIGFFEIDELDQLSQLSTTDWYKSKLIDGLFDDTKEEWGGVNQAVLLKNGLIGVIGHIAHSEINQNGKMEKHYLPMSFLFDRNSRDISNYKIITSRAEFPESSSKRSPELDNVLFPAGILGVENETVNLYVGISDYCCGKIKIKNPFN